MKFRPLHDRVVVRRVEEEERSAGGVIIPDTAKEKPMEGEIIAVGRETSYRWTLRRAIACCSENGREPRSRSMVKSY
jgi:co-chaperonin GroES (HSP10)